MKNLFSIIKDVHLITLTILVFINTFILITLVPIIGYHIMPDNQTAAELWEMITLIMQGCIGIVIMYSIVYVTFKIVEKERK